MNEQQLYDHAYTMLAETNTYSGAPEEIYSQISYETKYSLTEMVRELIL